MVRFDELVPFVRGFLMGRAINAKIASSWAPKRLVIHLIPATNEEVPAVQAAAAHLLVVLPEYRFEVMPVGWVRGVE